MFAGGQKGRKSSGFSVLPRPINGEGEERRVCVLSKMKRCPVTSQHKRRPVCTHIRNRDYKLIANGQRRRRRRRIGSQSGASIPWGANIKLVCVYVCVSSLRIRSRSDYWPNALLLIWPLSLSQFFAWPPLKKKYSAPAESVATYTTADGKRRQFRGRDKEETGDVFWITTAATAL